MPLKLKSGFMVSSGAEARLLMDCGVGDQIVLVSQGALEAIADPPRADEFRLQQFIEAFSEIASEKFDKHALDQTGHVNVTADDARAWRATCH
ncbi:hypothetical protein V6R98_27525 [Agrobacterium sp. CCNWLW71]|uniref:hypothetical protein n=1 Tax=unclassified Agrobacterium TaxID=2632611 RepID=UPI002FF2F9A3